MCSLPVEGLSDYFNVGLAGYYLLMLIVSKILTDSEAAMDYLMYPRLLGHAEVGWTPNKLRSWNAYKKRMEAHLERLDYLGVNYYRE